MFDPTAFSRVVTAGFDAWKLSVQIGETMIASQAVIGRRLSMLATGMAGETVVPFAEFSRLIPEKATAFGKAHLGATRALSVQKRRAPALAGALVQDGMTMLDWWERSIGAASAWWLPVHAQTTANARRLNQRR